MLAPVRPQLLRWQMEGYPTFHTTPLNLLLHIVAVPAFVGSAVALVASLATLNLVGAGVGLVGMAVAFAAQGFGHKREGEPPIPFEGPIDVATRVLVEQFVTFPRFVFSGGWWRALRKAG